ncbi:MAG: DUF3015 domain-containing protein [Bdellovibrionaceae bacterium]|nr:DUF3015 domain-containing protein [Pseudobdellovibrionaceae bacterium]
MKRLMLVLLVFGFSAKAFGYGAAGCGVGSLIFEGKNEWYEQVLAATTNATLGNQTFGITFGTLNCDANAINAKVEKANVFVAANKISVMNELAKGEGETVTVLAQMFSCQTPAVFADTIKSNYELIITDTNMSAAEIVENMDLVIKSNHACPGLG